MASPTMAAVDVTRLAVMGTNTQWSQGGTEVRVI
jgi:hypothetical protein